MTLKPTPVQALTSCAAVSLAIALSACTINKKVPQIKYDDLDFGRAIYQPDPVAPVKVVEIPAPLPLPGQIKPAPDKRKGKERRQKADERPPKTLVIDANKAAKVEPTKDGYVNAIQHYPYVKGALYQL